MNYQTRIRNEWRASPLASYLEDIGAEADATIAELLEALQACRDYLSSIPESAAGGDDDAVRLVRDAETAIKAAKGEA